MIKHKQMPYKPHAAMTTFTHKFPARFPRGILREMVSQTEKKNKSTKRRQFPYKIARGDERIYLQFSFQILHVNLEKDDMADRAICQKSLGAASRC